MSDFGDAIREGDGQRLLIFSCYGHTKYAYVTLLLLVRVHAILNQSEAFSLMSNRFCNTSGRIGRNIPLDLRLEHLNNLLKACLKALGANVNEESAQRIAAALNGIEMILNSVDKDCRCTVPSKVCGGKGHEESVLQIVSDVISINAFCKCPQRDGYSGFARLNANIISQLDYAQFYHWVRDKLKICKGIYSQGQ